MKKTIVLSLCLSFVATVAFSFPFGMPPKDNPTLSKVAPDAPGAYISWQENGKADSNSTNKVEKALATKSVQDALAKGKENILEKLSSRPVMKEFVNIALDKGATLFSLDDSYESLGGLILLGTDGPTIAKNLQAKIKKLADTGEVESKSVKIGKLSFYKVTSENSDQPLYWGVLGKGSTVLVIANSEDALVTILKNARTPEPAWIANSKKTLGIDRLSTFSYISLGDDAEARLEKLLENVDETQKASAEFGYRFLGMGHFEKIIAGSGLDDVGSVQKAIISMKDGWKDDTLPGALLEKPLTDEELAVIPADSVFALAGKTDINGLLKRLGSSKDVPDDMKLQLTMVGMIAGPYLSALGDTWSVFGTPEDGDMNVALTWSLKNPAMGKIQLKKLMELIKSNMKGDDASENEEDEDAFLSPMGLNKVIPTQLKLFDEEAEDEDDDDNNGNSIQIQVIPGGQIPNGVIPNGAIPQGAIPMGAVPLNGGIQLGGALPAAAVPGLMNLGDALPESVENIKIGGKDFWLFKKGEDNSKNLVIGIVGKNLVVTTKSYAEKYVKFDGKKNISSNKDVAKMMAKNPSYLIYFQTSVLSKIPQVQDMPVVAAMVDTGIPFIAGAYVEDDSIRLESTSGFPLPDMIISAGVLGGVLSQQAE